MMFREAVSIHLTSSTEDADSIHYALPTPKYVKCKWHIFAYHIYHVGFSFHTILNITIDFCYYSITMCVYRTTVVIVTLHNFQDIMLNCHLYNMCQI